MRSSKSRSRSKSNRNRSPGNNLNRVFDSSGPEGKVRGTPQQIIDKYNQLARDAQLGNDRVAAENFQQHAEHYTRLLGEAQREIEARREAQEAQNRERQQQEAQHQRERQAAADAQSPQGDAGGKPAQADAPADGGAQPEVMGFDNGADTGLVETPESKPEKPPRAPRQRRQRKPADAAPEATAEPEAMSAAPDDGAPKAAE